MILNHVKLYRITHIENIPHVLKNGITHKNSSKKNQHFKNIGDISLIDKRCQTNVIVDNGNYKLKTCKTITLGDFIPFYFGVRMPMLYVAQNGGNFVETPVPAEDIIYIASSLIGIISDHKEFYFSDGHATDKLTTFFDNSKIIELVNIIDWHAIKASYWSGEENLNLKRKKQAEFLVFGDIDAKHIVGYGCYNQTTKTKLISMGIDERSIKVIPNAYY